MELQRIFTPEYVNLLTNDIKVENYLHESIIYDDTQVRRLNGVEKPEGLEEKMLATTNEYEAAILLYEAYKTISPHLASSPTLWVYLTHVDLARYVSKLWPDLRQYNTGTNKGRGRNEEDMKKYIRDHWLISKQGTMRTTLKNLWWSVYLTVDENLGENNKYDLTKVFFSNNGMRTRRLGTGHLGRNKEALQGILSCISKYSEIFEDGGIENRMIWITRHFNLIGGTKPLSNQPSTFFFQELERYKHHLIAIKKREDVTGPNAFV